MISGTITSCPGQLASSSACLAPSETDSQDINVSYPQPSVREFPIKFKTAKRDASTIKFNQPFKRKFSTIVVVGDFLNDVEKRRVVDAARMRRPAALSTAAKRRGVTFSNTPPPSSQNRQKPQCFRLPMTTREERS